jgi:hypothetical protein
MSEINKFEQVLKLDLTKLLKKKGKNDYIPWASSWAEFKKVYPRGNFAFLENESGGYEFGSPTMGYFVKVYITDGETDGISHTMTLPVMDFKNQSLLEVTATDINKALMRCLAKGISLFGFALTTWAGEELFQSEIGEEADALRTEILEIATVLTKEYDARSEAIKIIGHGGKVNEIKDSSVLIEVRDSLIKKEQELKAKKVKTTKKAEEK